MPPGPPFDKQPIPMVGWRDDPAWQQLTQEVQACLGDSQKMATTLEKQAALRRAVPFPEYVDRALAVYIAPYDYGFRELVLAIAQQEGSSHEDTLIDEPIARMKNVRIGRDEGHITPLIQFCDLVLHFGSIFMGHVVVNHDYSPRHFKDHTA